MALGRVSLGEGINSNVGNCCVKSLRDLFSCLRETLKVCVYPILNGVHGLHVAVVNGAGQNNCQGGYQLLLNLHNFA